MSRNGLPGASGRPAGLATAAAAATAATPLAAPVASFLTLVAGGRASEREALIAAALVPGLSGAIILEGLADPGSALAALAAAPDNASASQLAQAAPHSPAKVLPQVIRIAPGCLCCTGNLVLRVTLNRILRRPPAQLFISLADATHIEQLRSWLASPQYQLLLRPGPDLIAGQ